MRILAGRLFVAGLLLVLASGCASRQAAVFEAPVEKEMTPGVLLRLDEGQLREFSEEQFLHLASMADYVLLGEGHTVACDHQVQARLLDVLARDSRLWAVGLEMLGADQQQRLDAVNRQAASLLQDAKRLEQELDWERNWGHSFELYAPVLQAALRHGMPLFALNIPKGLLKELRRKGLENLPAARRKWLPQQIIEPLEAQRKSLRQVFTMHQEFMTGGKDEDRLEQRLQRFFLVQSIWDTAMAQRAHELHRELKRPVAVIVGSGHVENGWGIEHRLLTLQPQAKVLLVAPWRGGRVPDDGLADIFYYCPESVTTKQGLTLAWMPDEQGGHALVQDVGPDSLAAQADLRVGDAIVKADGERLGSLGGLHLAAITASRKGRDLQLVILRNGYRLIFTLPLKEEQK